MRRWQNKLFVKGLSMKASMCRHCITSHLEHVTSSHMVTALWGSRLLFSHFRNESRCKSPQDVLHEGQVAMTLVTEVCLDATWSMWRVRVGTMCHVLPCGSVPGSNQISSRAVLQGGDLMRSCICPCRQRSAWQLRDLPSPSIAIYNYHNYHITIHIHQIHPWNPSMESINDADDVRTGSAEISRPRSVWTRRRTTRSARRCSTWQRWRDSSGSDVSRCSVQRAERCWSRNKIEEVWMFRASWEVEKNMYIYIHISHIYIYIIYVYIYTHKWE